MQESWGDNIRAILTIRNQDLAKAIKVVVEIVGTFTVTPIHKL